MKTIIEKQRLASVCVTPQALAWDGEKLWVSSRDLGTLYRLTRDNREIEQQIDPPGVIWAGVLTGDGWRFTIGKGVNDDRYIYRYTQADGFEELFPCPEFTGSYLSYDGESLYLSQWYKGMIHRLDDSGQATRTITVGAEVCGHTFVEGVLYVLCGHENKDHPGKSEEWRIARLDPRKETPELEELATIPFAARSLAHDGASFWSNHRAKNETIAFALPG